jgi:hypothetical protein
MCVPAPHFVGERHRTIHAHVRGTSPISTSTTAQDLTHAVLTGVCFGLRDGAILPNQGDAKVEFLDKTSTEEILMKMTI